MSKTRYIVCLLIFCSAICRAEDVVTTHNFTSPPQATVYSAGNTVGAIGDVVYTCSGTNAAFGTSLGGGSGISINLRSQNSCVVVSPPFERLKNVEIRFYPGDYDRTKIKIELSENGVDGWTEPDRTINTYAQIITAFPIGPYYVRITNLNKADLSIYQVKYWQSPCYCFDHQAE